MALDMDALQSMSNWELKFCQGRLIRFRDNATREAQQSVVEEVKRAIMNQTQGIRGLFQVVGRERYRRAEMKRQRKCAKRRAEALA